ncbi:MAG: UDP-N-acetylmuramoyl-L-alanine--D-glutamate ligase [Chloroflexota bacterium]|jgi:UDP-N-acetylmuramoylalanine--D-glutamate ligase
MVGSSTPVIDLAGLDLDSFLGRPVLVLGLARSGLALARFLADRGAQVTVYDGRSAAELADALAALGDRQPRLLLGPQVEPAAALEAQALICTSPSISSRYPTTEPRLRAALAAVEAEGRIPVVSEVDLFLRLCPARTVGITGTKGKTTTSSLIAAVLAAGEAPVVLGGNIGTPLIERLPELTPRHLVVLELSELQLPTLSRGTDVAVYTHVTSDHLDRHGSLEAYRSVKRRLVELLPADGVLVRNDDDPVVSAYRALHGARTVTYTRSTPEPAGVGVRGGFVVAGAELVHAGHDDRIVALDDIPLPGAHNVSNVLAAVATGLLHDIMPQAIATAIRGFGGVEHRLELVAEVAGVTYVNDSQGTQPDAVIAAVRAFEPPLVLIAGGRSKGVPPEALARAVAERVTAAVLIGETAEELASAFRAAGLSRLDHADSMDEAVDLATTIAREVAPATVLLSPAAASFDMFRDYEARGAAFKAAVARIASVTEPGADR